MGRSQDGYSPKIAPDVTSAQKYTPGKAWYFDRLASGAEGLLAIEGNLWLLWAGNTVS